MKVYLDDEKYEEVLVEIVVEQKSFYVPLDNLLAFPESYFYVALKPEWNSRSSDSDQEYKLIVNGRSSSLFRLIAMYLEFGEVPRDKQGECYIDSRLLEFLRDEADYYCLSALILELDELLEIKSAAIGKIQMERAYARRQVRECECDERFLPEGCIIGSDLKWFESENRVYSELFCGMLGEMLSYVPQGFSLACSFHYISRDYEIFVDGVNQSHTGRFDYQHYYHEDECEDSSDDDDFSHHVYSDRYDARGDVNFLPCFKQFEDHYGKAKLDVLDYYKKVLTTSCIIGLSLAPHKYSLKLIQLQYLSPEGSWTIDDEKGVKEDESAVGYVIVRRKSDDCKGGDLLLNTDVALYVSEEHGIVCFYGVDKHTIEPLTAGDQRVLVFAIAPGTPPCSVEHFRSRKSRMSVADSYVAFFRDLFDYINNRFVVGFRFYYSDTHERYKPFAFDTLTDIDKHFMDYVTANKVSVSFVVRGNGDGSVRILESPSNALLDCHKNLNNIQFVSLLGGIVYDLEGSCYQNKRYLKKAKTSTFAQFIAGAFILCTPNAC